MKPEQIRLSPQQSAWLQMIAPANVHATYLDLYKKKNPDGKVELLDNSAFGKFVKGEVSCPRDVAETIFEAYGTTWTQLEAIQRLPLRFPPPCKAEEQEVRAGAYVEFFFKSCGELLWGATKTPKGKIPPFPEQTGSMVDTVLDLVGRVIENRVHLTITQKHPVSRELSGNAKPAGAEGTTPVDVAERRTPKHLVFGEMLDYLQETRQFNRWGQWMVALSHASNRAVFPVIRSTGSVFPGCQRDSSGDLQYDQDRLEKLTVEELDEYAFFVRCLNMRINELRHRNYAEQEHAFDRMRAKFGASSGIFRALQAMRDEGKVPVRNYFRWALDNVKPFLEAIRHTNNPYRWYFLMCATRLMYDWARWHYYSVLDDDKRAACDMYNDIHELAKECIQEASDKEMATKCHFCYMAATACRYMAECASTGIWGRKEDAAWYVSEAVDWAKRAMEDWRDKAPKETTVGERKALTYRFARNCARIMTFASRWWLLHPTRYGTQPHMPDAEDDYPERYGIDLLDKATKLCSLSICAPINADEANACRPPVLGGKRLLEYEFHLRVCLEMMVHAFDYETKGESIKQTAPIAMSYFCRMVLIYAYLFRVGTEANPKEKRTALTTGTVNAARQWLARYDHYTGGRACDSPFDISILDKTIQKETPSIEETRFEMVCAFKYAPGTERRVNGNVLWRFLDALKPQDIKDKKSGVAEFLADVWKDAKSSLESDLAESVSLIQEKTKLFHEKNKTPELRIKFWKDYPPYCVRNALVNAPGNNPEHVACLMHHFGLEWDAVQKEKEAVE